MYPKPRYTKGNKHRHKSNKRLVEWTPCYICGKGAYATHEIFHNGTSHLRNLSMEYKAQIHVCMECDEMIHRSGGNLDKVLKTAFQVKLMNEHSLGVNDFITIFGRSYL